MFDFLMKSSGMIVNVNDMDDLLGKVELIDIREPYEVKSGTLKTAVNIPMGTLLGNPDKYMSKEKTYYIMCQSGGRSGQAVKALSKLGFDVVNVAGGMGSYSGSKKQ